MSGEQTQAPVFVEVDEILRQGESTNGAPLSARRDDPLECKAEVFLDPFRRKFSSEKIGRLSRSTLHGYLPARAKPPEVLSGVSITLMGEER